MSYFDIYNDIEQVLALHGVFGSKANWISVAKKLSKKFEVFVPDLPNHGLSPIDTDMPLSYEFLAQHMIAFIEKYMNPPINIIGHSMGGKTALLVAILRPDLVKKLVLVDITPKEYDTINLPVHNAFGEIGLDRITTTDREVIKQIISKHTNGDREAIAFIIKSYKKLDDTRFRWNFNAKSIYDGFHNIRSFPALQNITKLDTPVLIFKGDKSAYITLPEDEIHFSSYFNDYKIIITPEAGHNLHFENTPFFINELFNWL